MKVKRKRRRFLPVFAGGIVSAIILTIIFPIISAAYNKSEETTQLQASNGNALPQNNDSLSRYFTTNKAGSIDTGVIFMNPSSKETEILLFQVMLDTHSVSLSKYDKLDKFVELRVDGVIIQDGFIWEKEEISDHHIIGNLKVKNLYKGKKVYDENTKTLDFVFKNIEGTKELHHIYKGKSLK